MGLFNKLFGKKNEEPDPESGPMPTRGLKLQHAPTPDNGSKLAQTFVDAVKSNDNVELDYSPSTIKFVDEFLQRFNDEGLTVNDFAETIFVAGAYVGEVMVRNRQGEWASGEDINLPPGISMMPIVVKLPNGKTADPIAKAFKRFYFGDSDSIQYFYQIFTS